jgi:hypothetical protein
VAPKNSLCVFGLETLAKDKPVTTKYLFDNAAEREARARLTALAAQHNDATFRYMADPRFTAFTPTMFSAMGRKPQAPGIPSR